MKAIKKVGTEFKYYPVENECDYQWGEDLYYRVESPVYKKTLYGWIRFLYRKILRKKDMMEVVNETLKYHYKPIIIDGLNKESVLMKHLKNRRTEGDHDS